MDRCATVQIACLLPASPSPKSLPGLVPCAAGSRENLAGLPGVGGCRGQGVATKTRSPSSCMTWKSATTVPEKAGHVRLQSQCISTHDCTEPQVHPLGPQ